MLKLVEVLQALELEQMRDEADDRYFGEWLFSEWRRQYSALCCEAVRCARKMRERGLKTSLRSEWCNAAALLLDSADVSIQDRFLRSKPEVKDRMVSAVIADGGLFDPKGFFVELPPL